MNAGGLVIVGAFRGKSILEINSFEFSSLFQRKFQFSSRFLSDDFIKFVNLPKMNWSNWRWLSVVESHFAATFPSMIVHASGNIKRLIHISSRLSWQDNKLSCVLFNVMTLLFAIIVTRHCAGEDDRNAFDEYANAITCNGSETINLMYDRFHCQDIDCMRSRVKSIFASRQEPHRVVDNVNEHNPFDRRF